MKCVNRSVTLIWGKTAEIIEQCFCRHDGRWTHVSVVCVLSHDSPRSTGSWPVCGSAGSCRRRRIRTDRRQRRSECTRTWSDPSAWRAEPRSEPSEESRTSSGPPNTPHTPDHECTGRLQTAADASKHTCVTDQPSMLSTVYKYSNMKLMTSVIHILYPFFTHKEMMPVCTCSIRHRTEQIHNIKQHISFLQ